MAYHFYIVLHARISNPSFIFAIAEIFTLGKIARKASLFLEGLFEKCIADTELSKDVFVVYSVSNNHPKPDSSDGIV